MNVWGQVATAVGAVQFCATLIILYTVTIYPTFRIPFWLYLLILAIGIFLAVGFVLKWGISGYYRFFNQQSKVEQISQNLKKVMEHLGIEE